MLLNMFTSPDKSHFTDAKNSLLMTVLFFQKLNEITLSVTPSASQECLSHVARLDLEFWCKRLQIRSLQTNDLLITCHFTHCCPSPAHHCCSANMWLRGATVTWIKYLAALGERSWAVFYGPVTLDHSAAQQTHSWVRWRGEGRAARLGTHHGCGGLGNCLCWCFLNSGGTKWQPQPLQTWLPRDRLNEKLSAHQSSIFQALGILSCSAATIQHQAIPLTPTLSNHCQKKASPSLWSSKQLLGALKWYKARAEYYKAVQKLSTGTMPSRYPRGKVSLTC